MADLMVFILVLGACAILIGLMLDGAIPIPLQKLPEFPLRGRPATNGALLGTAIVACVMIAAWLSGAGPNL